MSDKKIAFAQEAKILNITADQMDEIKNPFVRQILHNVIVEGSTHSVNDFSFGEGFPDN